MPYTDYFYVNNGTSSGGNGTAIWNNANNIAGAPDGNYATLNVTTNDTFPENNFPTLGNLFSGGTPTNVLPNSDVPIIIEDILLSLYGYVSDIQIYSFGTLFGRSGTRIGHLKLPLTLGWSNEVSMYPASGYTNQDLINLAQEGNIQVSIYLFAIQNINIYIDSFRLRILWGYPIEMYLTTRKRRSYISHRNNETQIVGQQTKFKP